MKVNVFPSKLKGEIDAPPSKSYLIRALIIGALYSKKTVIKVNTDNLPIDVIKTITALNTLGAKTEIEKNKITVYKLKKSNTLKKVDVGECGTLIRFLIPIVVSEKLNVEFTGEKTLSKRPISELFFGTGIEFSGDKFPFGVCGKLNKEITLSCEKSSQHVSGILIALSKTGGKIKITGEINSKPYIDLTVSLLKKFGVKISEKDNTYKVYKVSEIKNKTLNIEGDYSSSSFYFLENTLGSKIKINGLNKNSKQGDKAIEELSSLLKMGVKIDASNIPDLVPLICGAAALQNVDTEIVNVERLKLKESDRIKGIIKLIRKFGGKIKKEKDGIKIFGNRKLKGCTIKTKDHRIIELACLLGLNAVGETQIKNAEGINKSYPNFFEDIKSLGGKVDVYR